jgi:hypothetical protein
MPNPTQRPWLGIECPRCHQETEIRGHAKITQKQLRQPFYYSHWYWCANPECKTTIIHDDRFKVVNPGHESQFKGKQHKPVKAFKRYVSNPEPWPETPVGKDEKPPWE